MQTIKERDRDSRRKKQTHSNADSVHTESGGNLQIIMKCDLNTISVKVVESTSLFMYKEYLLTSNAYNPIFLQITSLQLEMGDIRLF